MHPLVRDLYKRFLIAGENYPQGLSFIRDKVKEKFYENKNLTDEVEIKRAVGKGRYSVREIHHFNQFHKYRQMKNRYYN
jgi:hypothetical protein